MAKVVRVIELLSQSSKSWEDAGQDPVNEASKTLRNIRSISFGSRVKMLRGLSPLRTQQRKQDNVADRVRAREQHNEPVDADANTSRRRHTIL